MIRFVRRPRIPTGFKSISPGLAFRAGRQGAPTLGNRPHKFTPGARRLRRFNFRQSARAEIFQRSHQRVS
jgi:hypothetical protein